MPASTPGRTAHALAPAPVIDRARLPAHVAITMDGNGRWAAQRGQPRAAGHRRGAEVAQEIVQAASELGIQVLTLYTFSYENWQREAEEVEFLLGELLPQALRKASHKAVELDVRIRVIGDLARVSAPSRLVIDEVVGRSAGHGGMTVNLAISYSGRQEIVAAARSLAEDVAAGRLHVADIDEAALAGRLQTAGFPDPDLHIRCGGVNRLSNLMLWQMAYTEQLGLDVLWPDFTVADLHRAIVYFQAQPRKFGRVAER